MKRQPLRHPLAPLFWRAVDSIATSLVPDTVRGYRAATRHFLSYLAARHPSRVRSLSLPPGSPMSPVPPPASEIGWWPAKTPPTTLSETPAYQGGLADRHGPSYGEDNQYVYQHILHLTPSQITDLQTEGVI